MMRLEATIYLELLRGFNRNGISVAPAIHQVIADAIPLTEDEVHAIGDLLAADILELEATHDVLRESARRRGERS